MNFRVTVCVVSLCAMGLCACGSDKSRATVTAGHRADGGVARTPDASPSATGTATDSSSPGTPPVLTPLVWTDISPPGLTLLGKNFGSPVVEIDPSNPRTLYLCVDQSGMWKTTDGGSSWMRLGDPSAASSQTQTSYLDSPISVRVDPHDSLHLYATQGVRGNTFGFWESTDGGDTWAWPPGYAAIAKTVGTSDVTQFDVDRTDFKHVLLGSHSPWTGLMNAGLLETKDGGNSWVAHQPMAGWTSGSMGIHFLYEPSLGLGNAETWFVGESKFWRTTDSGTTWTKVAEFAVTHGGNDFYYTRAGVLYSGSTPYPVRSKDNGVTWEQLSNGPGFSYYYSVQGDGTTLYTQHANTGTTDGTFTTKNLTHSSYIVSPESDGLAWTPYQGGAQTFINGPFTMRFDSTNRIMYSANWDAGLWALKVD